MKVTKDLAFQVDARSKVVSGINKLADAVEVTLGPDGQLVLVEGDGYSTSNLVTKDGVTVAKQVILQDPIEDMGAAMLKDASLRANEQAGDGTTTTVVLARALVNNAIECLDKGVPSTELSKELELLGVKVEERLKSLVLQISSRDDFYKVAYTSSNGDDSVARIVADAYAHVGKDGVVIAEESSKTDTSVKFLDGFSADYGYVSPHFITSVDKAMASLDDTDVVIFRGAVQDLSPIMGLLEKNLSSGRPTLLVAKSFAIDVLGLLVSNKTQIGLKVCAVNHDENDELLNDMAVKVGCRVIPEGLKPTVTPDNIGRVDKAQITQKGLTLIGGKAKEDELKDLRSHIEALIAEDTTPEEKEKLQNRLARLIGGVAIISVGGPTIAYMKEKKDRIDDAICAVRSSTKHGVLPGGGSALHYASNVIYDDLTPSGNALRKALRYPYAKLHGTSSCMSPDPWFGIDLRSREKGYLFEMGVVDPALSTILAVRHAIAVCNIVLNTGCAITNINPKDVKSVEV